MSILFANKITY